ncbi:MAG: exodeoxyribonuclease VII small subunit [Oscillospiraceae bacterium]|nr:exodeoxyribonuclease VII small subunit [Oscillospiraceae bacterium]
MSFEKSVKRVDEIIEKLSSGDVPLEEAIELYKSGADELAKCRRLLEDAEKAVMTVKSAEEL